MADEVARKQAALAGARVPENVKQEIIAIAQEEFPRVSQLIYYYHFICVLSFITHMTVIDVFKYSCFRKLLCCS